MEEKLTDEELEEISKIGVYSSSELCFKAIESIPEIAKELLGCRRLIDEIKINVTAPNTHYAIIKRLEDILKGY